MSLLIAVRLACVVATCGGVPSLGSAGEGSAQTRPVTFKVRPTAVREEYDLAIIPPPPDIVPYDACIKCMVIQFINFI